MKDLKHITQEPYENDMTQIVWSINTKFLSHFELVDPFKKVDLSCEDKKITKISNTNNCLLLFDFTENSLLCLIVPLIWNQI